MTSGDIRKVQFLYQQTTLSKISEETGIPASSLSYISRGLRDVPRVYKTTLANFYRREAYDRLRTVGLSSYQANRFRWHAPEKVLEVENTMREKLMELTLGALSSRAKGAGGNIDPESLFKMFGEELNRMVKAIQKSPKNYEDIEKYGTFEEEGK